MARPIVQNLLSRRRFLGSIAAIGLLSAATACQQAPPPAPTARPSTGATATTASATSAASTPKASGAASAGPVTVSFTSQGNKNELAMFDKIFDEFEKQNSRIKIDRKYDATLSWPKVINELRTGTASDMMRTNDDDVFLLLASDVITSLDDFVHHDLNMKNYLDPTFTTRVGPGGEVGAAMVGTAPTVMFYNPALFNTAGVKAPTDWDQDAWSVDDFEEALNKLTQKSNGRTNVFGAAISYWWPQIYLWNNGIPLYNQDQTKAELATPDAIKLMERFQKWYTDGLAVPPGEKVAELFNGGFVAINIDDMGFLNSIKGSIKWDVAPPPKGKLHNGAFHNDRIFTIPKSSKVKDDAWELVKFWFSQSDDGETGGQAEIARNGWGVPTLKAAAEGPLFNDPKKPPEHRKVFAQGASHGWPIPDNPMGEQFQVIFRRIDALQTGKQTPEAFLKDGEDSLNRVIQSSGWNSSHNVRGWRVNGLLEKSGRGSID